MSQAINKVEEDKEAHISNKGRAADVVTPSLVKPTETVSEVAVFTVEGGIMR